MHIEERINQNFDQTIGLVRNALIQIQILKHKPNLHDLIDSIYRRHGC